MDSKGYRFGIGAALAALVAVCVGLGLYLGAVGLGASVQQIDDGRDGQSRAAERQPQESHQAPALAVRDHQISASDKAPIGDRYAAEERQRNRDDLVAQEVTATWTSVMGIVAVFALILSSIGIWLIYTTFRETRRSANAAQSAVEETKRIGEAQVRAYLSLKDAIIRRTRSGKLQFNVKIMNSGQSPANKLLIRWTSALGNNDQLLPAFTKQAREFKYLDEVAAQTTVTTPDFPVAVEGSGNFLFITIRLTFTDVFGVPATTKGTFTAILDQIEDNVQVLMLTVSSLLAAVGVEKEERGEGEQTPD